MNARGNNIFLFVLLSFLPSCHKGQGSDSGELCITADAPGILWERNSKVRGDLPDCGDVVFSVREGVGTSSAVLLAKGNFPKTVSPFAMASPAGSVEKYEDSGYCFNLPARQQWSRSGLIFDACPMVADAVDGKAEFEKLYGVLDIKLNSQNQVRIRRIRLLDMDGCALSGPARVDMSAGHRVLSMAESAGNTVELECPAEGVLIYSKPTSFRIALPEGEYRHLKLEIADTDGYQMTCIREGAFPTDREHSAELSLEYIPNGRAVLPTCHTAGGKEVIPVIDIQGHLVNFSMTRDLVRQQLGKLVSLGFNKLFIVQCQPGFPMFSSPRLAPCPSGRSDNHLRESIAQLDGNPNKVYAEICRELGIQATAIIKVYEGGGGITVPAGQTAPGSLIQESTTGGNRVYFDRLLSENLQYRLKRVDDVPVQDYTDEVTSIELDYLYNNFSNRTGPDTYTEYKALEYHASSRGLASVMEDKLSGIMLWVSGDNERYEPVGLQPSQLSWEEFTADVKDPNGYVIFPDCRQVRVRIGGLELGAANQYFAVSYKNRTGLYNIPASMIHLYAGDRELKYTSSVYARSYASEPHEWGREVQPVPGSAIKGIEFRGGKAVAVPLDGKESNLFERFCSLGFEFDWMANILWGYPIFPTAAVGIARGCSQYMKGTLCEAYPEVRSYWLQQVKDAITAGYSGVDIRLQCHSGMVQDFAKYVNNEPIVQKYRELWGVDITRDNYDFDKVMEIRGEFFMEFLREAASVVKKAGCEMYMHLRHSYETPSDPTCTDLNQPCNWTMPKIFFKWQDATDLCDGIVMKDYHKGTYKPSLGQGIKQYAHGGGKFVASQCYMQQSSELNEEFLAAMDADGTIDAIQLYEVVFDTPVWLSRIEEQLKKLKYQQ